MDAFRSAILGLLAFGAAEFFLGLAPRLDRLDSLAGAAFIGLMAFWIAYTDGLSRRKP